MVTARFRFYAQLNNFLPRQWRQREFARVCARAATVKHMVEALGIPHTEVAIVLVNGESCGFDRLLSDGDSVAVFPPFLALDVSELQMHNTRPAGPARFIADAHLGGLARMLRMAGFDTLYDNQFDDAGIADLAQREARIVLTRDRDLLKRRNVEHGCYVRALNAPAQLTEIVERLGLHKEARPFTLCLHCNVPLYAVAKDLVAARLPPAVRATQSEFCICDSCHGVFWKGSHWKRMCAVLAVAGAPLS